MNDLTKILNTEEITSIEFLGERETIDINVENTHMFFANDIYTHNSGFNKEVNDEQNIGKAIEPLQVADWLIIFSQTVVMEEKGEARVRLLKNRLGPKGLTLLLSYDPDKGTFEVLEQEKLSAIYDRESYNEQKAAIDQAAEFLRKRKEERKSKLKKIE